MTPYGCGETNDGMNVDLGDCEKGLIVQRRRLGGTNFTVYMGLSFVHFLRLGKLCQHPL